MIEINKDQLLTGIENIIPVIMEEIGKSGIARFPITEIFKIMGLEDLWNSSPIDKKLNLVKELSKELMNLGIAIVYYNYFPPYEDTISFKESKNGKDAEYHEHINFEELGRNIRNRVNTENLVLLDVFREELQKLKLNKTNILKLAEAVAPEKRLDQAFVIMYNALYMTPAQLENEIVDIMSGIFKDRFTYATLNVVEDLLGLRRDSLYSRFRQD